MVKRTWIALGIFVILFVAGIAFYAIRVGNLQECEASAAYMSISSFGETNADVTVIFEIRNLGIPFIDADATLDKIDYRVYRNGAYMGGGEVSKVIKVPPSSVRWVDTSFRFKYTDAGEPIYGILGSDREETMKWEVKGTTYLYTPTGDIKKVPLKFAKKDDVELYKDVEDLHDIAHKSFDEIAQVMNLTSKEVRSIYYKEYTAL